MNNSNKQSRDASSSRQKKGEQRCESTAIQKDVTKGSVSHAVSPTVSLRNGREKLKTETSSSQFGNQSCSQKPDCYKCVYRGVVDYSAHSCCTHPFTEIMNGAGKFLPMMYMIKGLKSPIEKRLNISYSQHGFDNGWFMWPINFDPTWLNTCDGFKEKSDE